MKIWVGISNDLSQLAVHDGQTSYYTANGEILKRYDDDLDDIADWKYRCDIWNFQVHEIEVREFTLEEIYKEIPELVL